jgi:DNA-binding NarL/FixJ family response regulator
MVVDDVDEVRTMLRVGLTHLHRDLVVVGEAATGEDAQRLAGDLQPDAVVLDLSLPDMSGRRTFRLLQRTAPASRLVIYTAADTDRAWYESHGARFVPKEQGLDHLTDALVANPGS